MTKMEKRMKMLKIQAKITKVTVVIPEMITRTQKESEGNPNRY